jgi:SAM-dependent methyltransferase
VVAVLLVVEIAEVDVDAALVGAIDARVDELAADRDELDVHAAINTNPTADARTDISGRTTSQVLTSHAIANPLRTSSNTLTGGAAGGREMRHSAWVVAPETGWAAIDGAAGPERFVVGLDRLREDPFFVQSKARMSALLPSDGEVLLIDVGCGTGEDASADQGRRFVVGIERSGHMINEARRRHPRLMLVAADGRHLPLATGAVAAVRADRVLQHLTDAALAVREFRRVLRRDGVVITFDPDLMTASVDGVDRAVAARVRAWRTSTRPGADTVRKLDSLLAELGFEDVLVERHLLDLTSLDRADGMMGVAEWGAQAAAAGRLSVGAASRWSDEVREANRAGTLRFRCDYVLAFGRAVQ